jgi:hypothetical protein
MACYIDHDQKGDGDPKSKLKKLAPVYGPIYSIYYIHYTLYGAL